MNVPLYTMEILRLAASLPDPRPTADFTGHADSRSPTCGSTISTSVTLDAGGRVADISQKVMACAFGQSAAALVEQHARGRSRDEVAAALTGLSAWLAGAETPPDWPHIEMLGPVRSRAGRHGAVLLPFRALLAAIEDAAA